MTEEPAYWPLASVYLRPASLEPGSIVSEIYHRTCRVDFDAPGFCVVDLGERIGSVGCRQLMVELKRKLSALHEATRGSALAFLSAARFDQQETTRPHLDGGPDECLLMLGYEPSTVVSELVIYDYARCAFDLALSPKEFMARHNPIFTAGHDMLRPYATRVPSFANTGYYIVCINNSSSAYSESLPTWQGTLHMATVHSPDETTHRMVNSVMIAPVPIGAPDSISDETLNDFVS